MGALKVPSPLPNRTLMLLLFSFATAKSKWPSSLKSPTATEVALAPISKNPALAKAIDGVGRVTSKNTVFDLPPPGLGLSTVITAVRALAMSEAVIVAVRRILLTNIVFRMLPFHLTTEPGQKPVPFTVRVNSAPPGLAASGTRGWLMNGTGFCAVATPVSAESQIRTLARHR